MSVKTISIELDVYKRLKALKRDDHESFSQVLRRSLPEKRGISGGELLALINRHQRDGTAFSVEVLDQLDKAQINEAPDDDHWA